MTSNGLALLQIRKISMLSQDLTRSANLVDFFKCLHVSCSSLESASILPKKDCLYVGVSSSTAIYLSPSPPGVKYKKRAIGRHRAFPRINRLFLFEDTVDRKPDTSVQSVSRRMNVWLECKPNLNAFGRTSKFV